ncbi:MAG TPA: DUF5990 family protein [Chloroflexota bacterium]|nr:DUF5990 family protein [Chloroflexota bacterium]
MLIEIEGTNLPGRSCHPNGAGESYDNIHVGLGINQDPIDLFPGDALRTRWRVEVRAVQSDDGSFDFRGRFVHGPRGDRFLYLNWVNVSTDGSPHLFRRAKLTLTAIDPGLVEQAVNTNGVLACTVNLTDAKGNPSCARFRPPDITWRVTDGNQADEPRRGVEA